MRVDDFDFDLPEERIALRPARPRDSARLLCVNPHSSDPFRDLGILDLPDLLRLGDALVFNNTRVLNAQLSGIRHRGETTANVSFILLKPLDASTWTALARPAKRLRAGDRVAFGIQGDVCLLGALWGRIEGRGEGGEVSIAFDFDGPALDEAIAALGQMPLPPYIASRRAPDARDADDYQTDPIPTCATSASDSGATPGAVTWSAEIRETGNSSPSKERITIGIGSTPARYSPAGSPLDWLKRVRAMSLRLIR